MASFDTLTKLAQHPEWIAPRSDVRVFLGEPGAPEATKTTVEPGSVFSPGMKTFGVTWWLRLPDDGAFFATESAPLESLKWRYDDGYLPIIHCETQFAGLDAHHTLFQDGNAKAYSEAVCARLEVTNSGQTARRVEVFIALRSLGPAGGPISDLVVGADGRSLALKRRKLPLLGFDRVPDALGCGVGDPSPLAREGQVPPETQAEDKDGWCYGLARFDVSLEPGERWQVAFDCPQQTYGNLERDMPSTAQPQPAKFEARLEKQRALWRSRFGDIDLQVPDADFRNAFFAGLQHMLTATVGDQARIAPLSYPLPWLRDSVYIIRCFDLAGLHDIARAATAYCARNDFFGGFGAEGDAPGQGIWALVEHYRVSKDREWLREVYPAIQRKCDWLFRMRRATEPIQVFVDTPTLAFTHAERAAGVICVAGRDGLIYGSMDHGINYALGWVNQWSLAGLREAAFAASELGESGDAARYQDEADSLQAALEAYAQTHADFFTHERTVNSLWYPTRAWESSPLIDMAQAGFETWWQTNRARADGFTPEPYWLYFESAQAHNALLFGRRDIVWQVLDYRMSHQDVPGLYGWREGGDGVGTDNAVYGVTLINQLRGCQTFDSITPHGWSQSELWLLQRAVLVEEAQEGLLLFAGLPDDWLIPDAQLGFKRFPTTYGVANAQVRVSHDGRQAAVTITGVVPGTPIRIRVGGARIDQIAGDGSLNVTFDL
jgi:hypothetical protein